MSLAVPQGSLEQNEPPRPTKLRQLMAELGWLDTLFYVVRRTLHAMGGAATLHRYYLVAQPVADKPTLPARRGASIEVREIGPGEAALAGLPRDEEAFSRRFGQDCVCLGAFKGEEVIGCLWLRLGPFDEDEVRCRFVPLPAGQAAWDLDVYVKPEYRTGPAFLKLWDGANAYLHARGVHWSISRISAFNAASINVHRRLGAQRLGSANYLSVGCWQLLLASLPPYVHLSPSARSVPRLPLRVRAP